MRHPCRNSPRSQRRARHIWLLAVVPALALAFAGVGVAAPSGSADLRITKLDGPDPVSVGAALTYTIQVENFGPDAATGVTVTDKLPKDVDFVSVTSTSGQCALKGKKVTCGLGNMAAPTVNYGGPPTVTLTVIPRRIGILTNTVSVKGGQKDPVGANNKATATTGVIGPPATCRGVPATIVGTAGADTVVATGGPDVIATSAGNDKIFALSGRDLICAGGGSDLIASGPAADRVFGGSGSDRLSGRGGADLLMGNAGDDVLRGNRGADRLRGGPGFDRCRGGAGADSIRGCER